MIELSSDLYDFLLSAAGVGSLAQGKGRALTVDADGGLDTWADRDFDDADSLARELSENPKFREVYAVLRGFDDEAYLHVYRDGGGLMARRAEFTASRAPRERLHPLAG